MTKIPCLIRSGTGELEITDLNNFYIAERRLTYDILNGRWTDAGTFQSVLRANTLVAQTGANKMPLTNHPQKLARQAVNS